MIAPLYPASSIKRRRRTKAELDGLLVAVLGVLRGEEDRITMRHMFYRVESLGVIEKTESACAQLYNHLTKWRRAGVIPWSAFADSTRWHRGATVYDDAASALENTAACYRKDLWQSQSTYLEVWTEKDAIAGLVSKVAADFGVQVFVSRGFASLTSLYDAAQTFKEKAAAGKFCCIAYFGDHDPSGVIIDRKAQQAFEEHGVEVELTREAILPEHIVEFDLPTRPTKASDSRSRGWAGGCVEIDALPAATLRQMVEDSITRHIEHRAWRALQEVEDLERESLLAMSAAFKRENQ